MRMIVLISSLLVSTAAWAQDVTQEVSVRQVQLPPISETTVIAVPLDTAVYETAATNLHDLRLLDRHEREVGYLVKQVTEKRTRTVPRTKSINDPTLDILESGGLSVRFSLRKEDEIPHTLNIRTPLSDFEHRVQLFGVVDGQEVELVDDVIFDYRRIMNLRRTTIKVPATEARAFHLLIETPKAEQELLLRELTREVRGGAETSSQEKYTVVRRPFRMDRIEMTADYVETEGRSPVEADYPVEIVSTKVDEENQATEIEIASHREPLTQLTFSINDKNFSRAVRLEVNDSTGARRRLVTETTLSSFSVGSIHEEKLEIHFPATREERYFVIISNGDSPPLEVAGVSAKGIVEHVYALVEPGDTMTLTYGVPDATRPNYDVKALQRALTTEQHIEVASLGPATRSEFHPAPEPFQWKDLWNNPMITIPVIAALVLLLGWGLFQATKRVQALEAGENGDKSSGSSASPN
ncbi:MAG: hypothetical protein KDA88_11995 [Planctomycetaceae bacterium]|nr:hypothetical protein [Planctomycetaceae bacterium]MCB9951883.1 hypothetical protein [Planctomycetaceae bacterium]